MISHYVWIIYIVVILVPVIVGGGRRRGEDTRTQKIDVVVCEQVELPH